MSLEAKRTLIFAVLKFLKTEINSEATSADVKESLEGRILVLMKINKFHFNLLFSSCVTMFRIMLWNIIRRWNMQE